MDPNSIAADEGAGGGLVVAARYPGHRVSASRVVISAIHSIRRYTLLSRGGQGHWATDCCAGGGPRLRRQAGGGGYPLPPRGARKRRNGRIPLGHAAETGLA